MTKKCDVAVIGGGPSGLNTARRLAEGGLDVVVLEKKREIGTQIICTGIVGEEIFEKFGLCTDSILRKIIEVQMVSPRGIPISYEHPSPFACVVDRERFDKSLAEDAMSKGALVEIGTKVKDISIHKDSVKLKTQHDSKGIQDVTAKVVIIATGIDFSLHRKLNLGNPKEFLFGAQAELEMSDRKQTTIFIGKDVSRGAFAWAVPSTPQKVRIGLLTENDPRNYFERFVKKFFPDDDLSRYNGKLQVKTVAQGLTSRTFSERVLAVGEAAGQVKTTTGGGIYFGLLCSDIASRVILQNYQTGSFTAASLSEYERTWKKTLQKEIVIGYWARKIGARLSDTQVEKIFQIARTDGIIPFIRENGNFDWHSELILGLARKVPLSVMFRNGLDKNSLLKLN